jgi:hypothetical protein
MISFVTANRLSRSLPVVTINAVPAFGQCGSGVRLSRSLPVVTINAVPAFGQCGSGVRLSRLVLWLLAVWFTNLMLGSPPPPPQTFTSCVRKCAVQFTE